MSRLSHFFSHVKCATCLTCRLSTVYKPVSVKGISPKLILLCSIWNLVYYCTAVPIGSSSSLKPSVYSKFLDEPKAYTFKRDRYISYSMVGEGRSPRFRRRYPDAHSMSIVLDLCIFPFLCFVMFCCD